MNLNPNAAFLSSINPESTTASGTGTPYLPSSYHTLGAGYTTGNFFSQYQTTPGSGSATANGFLDHMSQMFPQTAATPDLFYPNSGSYAINNSGQMYAGYTQQQYQPAGVASSTLHLPSSATAQMFMKNIDQYGQPPSSSSSQSPSSLSSASSSSIGSSQNSAHYFAQQFSAGQPPVGKTVKQELPGSVNELFTPYLFNSNTDHLVKQQQQPQRTSSSSSSASSSTSATALNYPHGQKASLAEHNCNNAGSLSNDGSSTTAVGEESSSNENSSPSSSNKPPVIYAWMKKVHTNGANGGKDNSGNDLYFAQFFFF
jgi:hypothetical protein